MPDDVLPTMGTYAGGAFHESLPLGKASGHLRADGDALRLDFEGGSVELPLNGLQAAMGGAAHRLVFFTHPDRPGWTFFTSDRGILKDATLNFNFGLGEQLARLRRSRRRTAALWLGALAAMVALMVALVLGLLLNRGALVDAVTRRIPPEVEAKLGEQALAHLRLTSRVIEAPEVLDPLQQAAAPLLAAPGPDHTFHLHMIDDDQVNAFALPGGQIVFTTGLLLEAGSAEEVLGVLAHEMAHSVKRHTMRQLVMTLGLSALLQAFVGDTASLATLLADGIGMLARNGYSREQEREADRTGFEYLVKAGLDPQALLTFMQRQQQKLRDAGVAEMEKSLSYFSTHPSFEERVDYLNRWMKEPGVHGDSVKVSLDYERFKATLRETLQRP